MALDETPNGGNGSDGDCFMKLNEAQSERVRFALEHKPMTDAANVMNELGMCQTCVAYYSYATVSLILASSGMDLGVMSQAAGHAVGSVMAEKLEEQQRGGNNG